MAFAAGVYTLPAGNPVVTATTISSSWANTTLSDIATALSTCVLKDGTQTLTANIPMGGFKLTGLAVGTSANDSVSVTQLQSNTTSYLTGTAGTNTVTASASPALTALAAGQRFFLIPANTNTGATTLQINSTAATNVFWNGAALVGGEIRQNVPIEVFYDGTQYQLIASAAMANTFAIPDTMRLQAAGDRTKMFVIGVTGVPTSTIVTMNAPRTGGSTFVGDTLSQTLTNKTLTSPTINTLITGSAVAVKADMSGGTSLNLMVSPGQVGNSRASAKAWGYVSIPNTVQNSYPATGVSVTNPSPGSFILTFGMTMATAFYKVDVMPIDNTQFILTTLSGTTTTTVGIDFGNTGSVGTSPQAFTYTIFGDV